MQSPPIDASIRPHSRRCRAGLALFGTLMLAAPGCGGLAASPALDEPEASDPGANEPADNEPEASSEDTTEAADEVPTAFDVLDLRQLYESASLNACEFARRIKINVATGTLIISSCEIIGGGPGTSISNSEVTPEQRAAVQQAYLQVRASSADNCTNRDILTLTVQTGRARDRRHLLFADDDHAGCPAASVRSTGFVSGLPELFEDLTRLLGP